MKPRRLARDSLQEASNDEGPVYRRYRRYQFSKCGTCAVVRGIDLTLLNRGRTSQRPVPEGAKVLIGDIRQPASVRELLGSDL